ncbi:MAG: dephospho-CoA kinase [Pseudomonadota bacterium]
MATHSEQENTEEPHLPSAYIVGLTGGIGSGKTVASDYFAEIGVPVIDTDIIARQVVEPGQPALVSLVAEFGEQILLDDGNLDRDAMRKLAFSSLENKAKLDAITHPAIRVETARQLAAVTYPYCIVVIPLLTADSAFQAFIQRVLIVSANEEVRIARVMKRNGLPREAVVKIIESQLSDEQRAAFADDVIVNETDIAHVQKQVDLLHQEYLKLSLDFV